MKNRILTVIIAITMVALTTILFTTSNTTAQDDAGQIALDKIAIVELASVFENTFDAGDIDGHMNTWAENITFESPFGNYATRADYRAWVEGFYAQTQEFGGTRHLINNCVVDVDGDSATMFCYLTILSQATAEVNSTAVFTGDRLQRIDGEWKFIHRSLEVDESLFANQQQ